MRLKFNDGSIRDLPDNPKLAARLIHISQQTGGADYRVEVDPDLPLKEQKEQADAIQFYVDWYRMQTDTGKKF